MNLPRATQRRLPDCMICVLDHLAPGLPPGEQALLIRMARHAHDAGCGIYPGQRGLGEALGASRPTLRKLRDRLLERGLLERLPRKAPHGADLYRLRLCLDCQRATRVARCGQCQRANLLTAETAWWAAQRATRVAQKSKEVQGEPAATPDHHDGQAAPVVPLRPAPRRGTDPPVPRTPPAARRRAGRDGSAAGTSGPTDDGGPQL
jgi:hypothetical protein